jgi:hypothetical protein
MWRRTAAIRPGSVAIRRARPGRSAGGLERPRGTPALVWRPAPVVGRRSGWAVGHTIDRSPIRAAVGPATGRRRWAPLATALSGRARSSGRPPRTAIRDAAVRSPAVGSATAGSATAGRRARPRTSGHGAIRRGGVIGRIGTPGTPRRRAAGLALRLCARLGRPTARFRALPTGDGLGRLSALGCLAGGPFQLVVGTRRVSHVPPRRFGANAGRRECPRP